MPSARTGVLASGTNDLGETGAHSAARGNQARAPRWRADIGARADAVRDAESCLRAIMCIYSYLAQLRTDTVSAASNPDACTCARLRRASRAVTQLYDDALAQAGLRATQFALLRTLERGSPVGIGSLAQTMLVDRTALSRNLDPLVARGLVAIAAGDDARTRRVTLTPSGRRALAQADPLWSRVQRDLESRIGAKRIRSLYDALEALETLHPARAPR